MSKSYVVSFKLWDVTRGERTGELIDENGPHTVSPLSAINEPWEAWTRESPVPLDPLNHRTIRVSMSRNDGESVTRRRFEHDGAKYLITVHTAPAPEKWLADEAGVGTFAIHITGGVPRLYIPGHGWVVAKKQDDSED